MREVNTGFGEGLATAFEMVVTPAIFGFLGYLVDRWVGTNLVFMFTFGLFVFGYMLWKLAVRYNTEMDKHLADAPWARTPSVSRKEGPADA
jgi:hypothetical protein